MDLKPPAGSKISVTTDDIDPIIVIPNAGGATQYFMGLFLLFWLGGWFIGFRDVGSKLMSGQGNAFLFFWFGGWTLGGIAAVLSLYRILRPAVPESLTLRRTSIGYDSGISPPQFGTTSRYRSRKEAWNTLFPKRVRIDFDRRQLQSLRLRETGSGNRLTIDVNATRLDIAPGVSEVEREWLVHLLAQRYSLPQAFGNAADDHAGRVPSRG